MFSGKGHLIPVRLPPEPEVPLVKGWGGGGGKGIMENRGGRLGMKISRHPISERRDR